MRKDPAKQFESSISSTAKEAVDGPEISEGQKAEIFEGQKEKLEKFADLFIRGPVLGEMMEIQKDLNLPKDVLWEKIKEIYPLAREMATVRMAWVLGGGVDGARKVQEVIGMPEDEFQEAAKMALKDGMLGGLFKNLWSLDTREKLGFTKEDFQEIAKEAVLEGLTKKIKFFNLLPLIRDLDMRSFSLPEEFYTSPEIQSAAKEGFLGYISVGRPGRKLLGGNVLLELNEKFKLPNSFFSSREMQGAGQKGIVAALQSSFQFEDSLENVESIKDLCHLSNEQFQGALQDAIAKKVSSDVDNTNVDLQDEIIAIKERFNLPEDFVKKAVERGRGELEGIF